MQPVTTKMTRVLIQLETVGFFYRDSRILNLFIAPVTLTCTSKQKRIAGFFFIILKILLTPYAICYNNSS